jgi:predicted O-linked N-acetylglucosamine transferase (SPINDLY family)
VTTGALEALIARAGRESAAGRFGDALATYRRALALAPHDAELHHNVGALLARAGDADGAERHLREAERLAPQSPLASLALGHLDFARGRLQASAQAFERALQRAPSSVDAVCNLGLVLHALRDWHRALPVLARARRARPESEVLVRASFEALEATGAHDAAERELLAFAGTAQPSPWLAANGLHVTRRGPHPEQEAQFLAMALHIEYGHADLRALDGIVAALPYFDVTRADMAALHRRYDALMQETLGASVQMRSPVPAYAANEPRRLRVGYLSSDFRRHVMGELMREIVARHDRKRFEIVAYSLAPAALEDAVTQAIRNACDGFVALADLDDTRAAQRIAHDAPDVLVDLASHTPQARPGILLRKPAPVIVTHLGDHGTIGLRQVDFRLTDPIADRSDAGEFQIERPLALQGCVMPFRRIAAAPDDGATRERLGIAANAIVFGAFSAVQKLSPRCLALWRCILDGVPNGVLALSPFTRDALERSSARLRAAGISAQRIVILQPSADDALNRARYRHVDVVLDTLPYTGGDSTVAALDMAVPVVTLAGERQAQRMGLSLLTHLGVTDTIALSDEEYVALAIRLATDAAWRATLSARIAERVTNSGIADLDRYTRDLERALERAITSANEHKGRR